MTDRPSDLSDLSDRDLMLNLWLTAVMDLDRAGRDPARVVMSVVHLDAPEPAPDARHATLAQVLAEVERRLGIDDFDISTEKVAVQ